MAKYEFPKGNKFSKGRPKGSFNKVTIAFREDFDKILNGKTLAEWLHEDIPLIRDPEARNAAKLRISEFMLPKIKQVEISGELDHTHELNDSSEIDELKEELKRMSEESREPTGSGAV